MANINEPAYPWSSGQVLDADQLNAAFVQQTNLYNSLANSVALVQNQTAVGGPVGITLNWAGGAVVTNGTYVLELECPYAFTINSVNYAVGTTNGSFTINVVNAGTSVTGLGALYCSSPVVLNAYPTGNNVVAIGTTLSVIISGVTGSPTNAVIQVTGVKAGQAATALPVATAISLGGVIIGSGLNVTTTGLLAANVATSSVQGVLSTGTGLTNVSGAVSVTYGTTANTAVQGNDSRLNTLVSSVSPAFTGIPTAPTAPVNTSSTQIATTAFVLNQGYLTSVQTATNAILGVVSPDGTTISNHLGQISVTYGTTANTAVQGNDTRITLAAPLASPTFTGTPLISVTPALNDNSFKIADTAYVDRAAGYSNLIGLGIAPLASPQFTGAPTAPTPTTSPLDSTTKIATTAFVLAAISSTTAGVTTVLGNSGNVTLAQLVTGGVVSTSSNNTLTGTQVFSNAATFNGAVSLGSSLSVTGTTTLTGIATAPTPQTTPTLDNSTKIATTAFVNAAVVASTAGVSTVVGNSGAVTLAQLQSGGVASTTGSNTFTGNSIFSSSNTFSGVQTFTTTPVITGYVSTATAATTYATLASPTFTGTPSLPTGTVAITQTAGNNTTFIATTAFVTAAVSASTTGVSSVIGNTGAVTLAQLVTGGVAPLASPTFTGSPVVPGYVTTSSASSTYAPLASPTFTGTPIVPGYLTTASAASTYAPLASPTFTGTINLTGAVVTAATATLGTNTTQIATTAFVQAALANDVVGTIGAGVGPGDFYADSSGNMTVDTVYPFPPMSVATPVLGSIWLWNPPRACTIQGVYIAIPQLTGSGNSYTIAFYNNGTIIPGLTSITINGTTGGSGYTPSSAIALTSSSQIYWQIINIVGTIPSATTVFVQYYGVYA